MGYRLNQSIRASELARISGLKLVGSDIEVFSVSAISDLTDGTLSFSNTAVDCSEGSVIVMPASERPVADGCAILASKKPRLDFIRTLDYLNTQIGFSTYENPPLVHETAVIGENVVIESGCHIHANVVIEPNVVLHKGTVIGEDSLIRSCTSIGGDGFGFERLDNNKPIKFPHLGRVIVGKNVEIGSCTAIARGTLSDTVIEDDVKIDNLVHVAHNVLIKKGAFVIACAEISGGVIVEEGAWIAPNSSTHQKIRIGKGSIVGLGAVVTKDIEDKTIWAGNPAKKLREID